MDDQNKTEEPTWSPIDRCWLCDEQYCDTWDDVFDEPVHQECIDRDATSRGDF